MRARAPVDAGAICALRRPSLVRPAGLLQVEVPWALLPALLPAALIALQPAARPPSWRQGVSGAVLPPPPAASWRPRPPPLARQARLLAWPSWPSAWPWPDA